MKLLKKVVALVSVITFSFSLMVLLFAVSIDENVLVPISENIYKREQYSDYKTLMLEEPQINDYARTVPNFDEEVVQTLKVMDYATEDFQFATVQGYQLSSVSQINDTLYFEYHSEQKDKLYLVYRNNILIEQTIYENGNDTLTTIRGNEVKSYPEFYASAIHEYDQASEKMDWRK